MTTSSRYPGSFTGLSCMPSDVIQKILLRLGTTDKYATCHSRRRRRGSLWKPQLFAPDCRRTVPAVCRSWAEIASSAESFWSELHIDAAKDACDLFKVSFLQLLRMQKSRHLYAMSFR